MFARLVPGSALLPVMPLKGLKLRWLLPFLFAVFVLAGICTAWAETEPVWIFECEHFGSGLYRFYVAKEAIKVESLSSGVVTLAKAPQWRVSCFNRSLKEEWTGSLPAFNPGSLAIAGKNIPLSVSDYTVVGEENLKGLRCKICRFADNTRVWTPVELKTSPQCAMLVSRFFNLPRSQFVLVRSFRTYAPARVTEKSIDKAQLRKSIPWLKFDLPRDNLAGHAALDLKKWWRAPYKAGDFEYPTGYKKVSDIKEILISREQRKDIEGLMDALSR